MENIINFISHFINTLIQNIKNLFLEKTREFIPAQSRKHKVCCSLGINSIETGTWFFIT